MQGRFSYRPCPGSCASPASRALQARFPGVGMGQLGGVLWTGLDVLSVPRPWQALAQALTVNHTINFIDLRDNGIGAEGCKAGGLRCAMVRWFSANQSLR